MVHVVQWVCPNEFLLSNTLAISSLGLNALPTSHFYLISVVFYLSKEKHLQSVLNCVLLSPILLYLDFPDLCWRTGISCSGISHLASEGSNTGKQRTRPLLPAVWWSHFQRVLEVKSLYHLSLSLLPVSHSPPQVDGIPGNPNVLVDVVVHD